VSVVSVIASYSGTREEQLDLRVIRDTIERAIRYSRTDNGGSADKSA
jgi:hypothetical protein